MYPCYSIIFKVDPVYVSDYEFNKLICRLTTDQLKIIILIKKNKLIESKIVLENAVAVTI
jgi:hypothetical protein